MENLSCMMWSFFFFSDACCTHLSILKCSIFSESYIEKQSGTKTDISGRLGHWVCSVCPASKSWWELALTVTVTQGCALIWEALICNLLKRSVNLPMRIPEALFFGAQTCKHWTDLQRFCMIWRIFQRHIFNVRWVSCDACMCVWPVQFIGVYLHVCVCVWVGVCVSFFFLSSCVYVCLMDV